MHTHYTHTLSHQVFSYSRNLSLSLSLSIYIYIYIYICLRKKERQIKTDRLIGTQEDRNIDTFIFMREF